MEQNMFNGVCPICGSQDGMIIHGKDGMYRNMCRVINCPAYYKPAPAIGFHSIEDCRNPFDAEYLRNGNITVGEYLNSKKEVE